LVNILALFAYLDERAITPYLTIAYLVLRILTVLGDHDSGAGEFDMKGGHVYAISQ